MIGREEVCVCVRACMRACVRVRVRALQEGAAINLSLTMLGNVITALAEKSNNPKKNVLVPYRESKLTCILQVSLSISRSRSLPPHPLLSLLFSPPPCLSLFPSFLPPSSSQRF
jgi:hypothetical protein